MRRRPLVAGRVLAAVLLASSLVAPSARAASPAPSEPCVAGTIWEDTASGVKYLCVYDEMYGGTRWELLSSGQSGAEAFTARSTVTGCVLETVAISLAAGGGGNTLLHSLRWPCTAGYRSYQPPGEMRVRTIIQRYASGWSTCRDSGYSYNTVTAWTLVGGIDMGASPDCGTGAYRTWGYGAVLEGGAWRGSSLLTPSLWLD
jgi:hypothetical protein